MALLFPSPFFSRNIFVNNDHYINKLAFVFANDACTFVCVFEIKDLFI